MSAWLNRRTAKPGVDSIQQKIEKLNSEIEKGNKVYTAKELNTLKAKLIEVSALLDDLEKPGG